MKLHQATKFLFRLSLSFILLIVMLVSRHSIAYASTITVTTTADSGAGSLRQALFDATAGDVITFDASLTGQTITLASQLVVSTSLTIDGTTTPNVTVSGNNSVRVFSVTAPATLMGFTVANGQNLPIGSGAGINTNSDLTLILMHIIDNHSRIGGGIAATSGNVIVINQSTISGNTALLAGGGLTGLNTSVTIVNSAIYSNTSDQDGGGLEINGGSLLLENSTVSGNQATQLGGGVWTSSTDATLHYSTLTNNQAGISGGGLYVKSGGSVALASTIIANSPNGGDCIGTISDTSYNFIEDSTNACGLTNALNNNSVGQDPNLTSLGNYGGPTWTHNGTYTGILSNRGNPATCPATDQRGVTRPHGAGCDVGSVEFDTAPLALSDAFTVTRNSLNNGLSVLNNDSDPDAGDLLTITVVSTLNQGGTAILGATVITYTPALGFVGTEVFTYTVSDGFGGQANANVSVNVVRTPPTVLSITRINSNPSSDPDVSFAVIFSDQVSGVDLSDFALTTSGVSGASVTSVSVSDATTYIVNVNTGSNSGTIRLDLIDNDSIKDLSTNPLGGVGVGNGTFTGGETYTIDKPTPTPTSTSTPIPTSTSTSTPIPTSTSTPIPTSTSTSTPVPTATATSTPSATATQISTGPVLFVAVSGQNVNNNCRNIAVPCSTLSYAIGQAQAADTIRLAAGTYTEQVTVTKSITIEGASADTTILQAASAPNVATGSTLTTRGGTLVKITVEKMTVRHGNGDLGGGLSIDTSFNLVDGIISDNAANYGGGIYLFPDKARTITIRNTIIRNNQARITGLSIYASETNLLVENALLQDSFIAPSPKGISLEAKFEEQNFDIPHKSIFVIAGNGGASLRHVTVASQQPEWGGLNLIDVIEDSNYVYIDNSIEQIYPSAATELAYELMRKGVPTPQVLVPKR